MKASSLLTDGTPGLFHPNGALMPFMMKFLPAGAFRAIKRDPERLVLHQLSRSLRPEGLPCFPDLTEEAAHVPILFMSTQRSLSESAAPRGHVSHWPTSDSRLAMMESQLVDLAEINEIGMTFIRHLDAQAAAVAAKGGTDLADIARSRRELSREIHLNKKLAAQIGEDLRRRLAELGIPRH